LTDIGETGELIAIVPAMKLVEIVKADGLSGIIMTLPSPRSVPSGSISALNSAGAAGSTGTSIESVAEGVQADRVILTRIEIDMIKDILFNIYFFSRILVLTESSKLNKSLMINEVYPDWKANSIPKCTAR
jgi:hypothetical protein